MAGAGAKLFNSGDILTAAQVNTYLMDQTVMRFATNTDRDNAFGGAGEPTLAEGMLCYVQDSNTIQCYDGSAWYVVADVNASKDSIGNAIHNGSMAVWQRGLATVTMGVGTRVQTNCDRWIGIGTAATQTVQQSTSLPTGSQSSFSLQLNGGAGGTTLAISQRMEHLTVPMIRGLSVFSCSLFNSTGAAFTPTLEVSTPATANNNLWTTPTLRTTLTAQQSCANGAWTTVTFVATDFSALTNASNGLQFNLVCSGLGTGTLVRICDVQCTRGTIAVPFTAQDYQTNLATCQRYFVNTSKGGTYPANYVGAAATTSNIYNYWTVPVVMRSDATFSITLYSNAGTANKVSLISSATDVGGTVTANTNGLGPFGFIQVTDSGTAFTANFIYTFYAFISADLG